MNLKNRHNFGVFTLGVPSSENCCLKGIEGLIIRIQVHLQRTCGLKEDLSSDLQPTRCRWTDAIPLFLQIGGNGCSFFCRNELPGWHLFIKISSRMPVPQECQVSIFSLCISFSQHSHNSKAASNGIWRFLLFRNIKKNRLLDNDKWLIISIIFVFPDYSYQKCLRHKSEESIILIFHSTVTITENKFKIKLSVFSIRPGLLLRSVVHIIIFISGVIDSKNLELFNYRE